MGLAPWAGRHRNDIKDWYFPSKSDPQSTGGNVGLGDNFYHSHNFMSGNPFDGSFKVFHGMVALLSTVFEFLTVQLSDVYFILFCDHSCCCTVTPAIHQLPCPALL